MGQVLAVLFCVILFTIPAAAQIYNTRSNEITGPLDREITQFNAQYANEVSPGDEESARSQRARYFEMTDAVNSANKRHFEIYKNEAQ